MNLPPTRERAPSREARQAPWRGLAAPEAASGDRRRPPELGGPHSPAHWRARPCQFAAAWVAPHPGNAAGTMAANDKPPPQPRYVHRVPRKTATKGFAKANPQASPRATRRTPTGACVRPRWRPPPGLPLPFATLGVLPRSWAGARSGTRLGQARAWARHAVGPVTGRLQLCCPSKPSCRSGAPGLWRRARGRASLRGKKGCRQQRAICIGRQQGSLFPAPLHSTVWATTKNWTRQRRK